MKALVLQYLLRDMRAAPEEATEALKYNANFIPAKGMLGIAEIHLGKVAEGTRLLREVTEASPDDANQHRHRRELAIAHLTAGDAAAAVRRAARRRGEMPDMKRNAPVLAGQAAGAR